jgi:hypothetical protein
MEPSCAANPPQPTLDESENEKMKKMKDEGGDCVVN